MICWFMCGSAVQTEAVVSCAHAAHVCVVRGPALSLCWCRLFAQLLVCVCVRSFCSHRTAGHPNVCAMVLLLMVLPLVTADWLSPMLLLAYAVSDARTAVWKQQYTAPSGLFV